MFVRDWRRRTVWAATAVAALANPTIALQLDHARHLELTGKVFSQAALRMEDSDSSGRSCFYTMEPGTSCSGFTFPDTRVGQLVQHRNLIDIELFQDVGLWLNLERMGIDSLSYRFRVKYFYDGVYDYGPRGYSEPSIHVEPDGTPDVNGQAGLRANNHAAKQHDPIWNAYVDLAKGPAWLRIGRQDLSWGESDGFRLLDMIEPLDARIGFPLVEDLDDRRIPLWMLRPSLRLPSPTAMLANLVFEGYWVPGVLDNQESPVPQVGNPFTLPSPPTTTEVSIPPKTFASSRGGGRLLGTAFQRVTFSLGHYLTFNDAPSVRLTLRSLTPQPDAPLLIDFYQQQVTGGSASFALPFDPMTILRSEIAQFWDERVFIPDESANLQELLTEFLAGGGMPVAGALPTRDVLRWMIGLDRTVWLRWLNPSNQFLFSVQYFHTHISDFDDDISFRAASSADFPEAGLPSLNAVPRRRNEILFTYLLNTLYLHGTLIAQVFGAYDPRGVNVVVPALTYQFGTNVQFTLKYAVIAGNFVGLGFLRDRDEVLFRVQYNLS